MPFRERHIRHFKTLASIRTPRVISAVAIMLSVGVTTALAFLVFAPWVQTSAGAGIVTALNPNDRLQEINALVSGRIVEWHVREGSAVRSGDPIVRIVDNDPLLIERLEAEKQQVVAKIKATRIAEKTALLDYDRMKSLFEKGLSSRRDYEQAQIRVETLRTQVADAEAELNRIDVTISRQSMQIVRAPRDGVIIRMQSGDAATFVNAGDVVATFVPENVERAVELFIDGRDVALVRPGSQVRLQFEGWPVVQFSGWPSIAIGTFGGVVTAIDPSADANGRFRILITEDKTASNPWPDERYVRFGASARGWVLLEKVSVGYELWRQLNNFPPEFPAQSGASS
ncbi:efflux RND transporter periplasmic adaptor subunit [Hyphococcus sp.]|jgi:multidrug efflux pump subunit AcrA (membrane-fusion protein)|uniref:efflux RND transporter periplasmic adaptor subunit n=1 Tax=Hyphococcus sp. TaxID=2038636 RepID=UPI003D1008B1